MASTAMSVSGAALFVATSAAAAQDAQADTTVEEITISATKRDQSIQDVPIAVSVHTAEQLARANVTDLRELAQISPSLFLSSSASEAAGAVARIRGVGTTGDNPGLESSVAIFIDGVYQNRTNVGLSELGEIESIEVLRGPQGTLFGRNASAGLINVRSKGPEYEFGGYGEAEFGNFNHLRFAAGLTGPIAEDKAAFRIDGVYFQRDGFLEDAVATDADGDPQDFNDRDRYLIRGQLQLDPSEAVSIRIIADYSDRDEDCCAAVTLIPGATAGIIEALGGRLGSGGFGNTDPFDRNSATTPGRRYQQDVESWGVSAEIEWAINDNLTLTSVSAYRDWELLQSQDIDFTSADILYREVDGSDVGFETFSQEIRLNGQWGAVDWLVGGYYADEDLSRGDQILLGEDFAEFADFLVRAAVPTFAGYVPTVAAVTGGAIPNALAAGTGVARDQFDQNSENWAIFSHNIIELNEALDLTLGARFTSETKDLDTSVSTNNATCSALVAGAAVNPALAGLLTLPCLPFFNPLVDSQQSATRDEDVFTGTVALNYRFENGLSTYASYSRGYKAGGFNLDRAALTIGAPNAQQDLEFEEETVDAFEVGAKYASGDGTFSANFAAFYSQFDDFQLNTFNGISFVVENLPSVDVTGFELETLYVPNDNWSFSGGVTYADTEYGTSGFDAPIFAQPSAENPGGGALFQLPGETITNAPEWSVTGSVAYEQPLSDRFKFTAYLDGRWTSEINTGSDLDLEKVQDDFIVVNGSVGIAEIEGGYRLEFWARNIFDEDYFQIAFDGPLQGSGTARNTVLPNTQTFNAFLAEPRTYGIRLRYDF